MASSHVALITAGGTSNRRIASSIYGYCTTSASTVAKTVTLYTGNSTTGDGTWAAGDLFHGLTITVRFQYANTSTSPTLNVNGTGAKPIYRYGTTVPGTSGSTSWNAQGIVTFTYDTLLNASGCWVMNDHLNTTYSTGTEALLQQGTNTTNRLWSAQILHDYIASKEAVNTHLLYATPTATGTTSLASGTVTQVPLSAEFHLGDSSVLNMMSSGIHVELTGVYRIDFSTYVTRGSAGMSSAFVRVSSNHGAYSASTEIAASNGYTSSGSISPNTSASLVAWLQDDDIVYLAARSVSAAGTLYNENAMTYLSVQYLGYSI